MTSGGFGLVREDLERQTARFGFADDQVRRDHAISHILGAISNNLRDDVIFFGGTALSRTHLVHARLSEDIDMIALGNRTDATKGLVNAGSRCTIRQARTNHRAAA
jgi:predicted nucleotidyltransferase component of viral defense system